MADSEKIKDKTIYSAVSANRHENNLTCHRNFLIYSKSNCPIIYEANKQQVIAILLGHSNEVNGQCLVHDKSIESNRFHIISTSYDTNAIIWSLEDYDQSRGSLLYKLLYKFSSPDNKEFNTRCSILTRSNNFISITSTIDALYLWQNDKMVETIPTRSCFLESKLFSIEDSEKRYTFVFLANSDNKIVVYQLLSEDQPSLHYLMDLTGHSDWTKCIDLLEIPNRNLEFLIASASQDSFTRIWHMKIIDHELDLAQIRTSTSKTLAHCNLRLTATLETVLSGHEGKVTSLCWFKKQPTSEIQLLSCSADKTVALFQSKFAVDVPQSKHENHQPASIGIWKEVEKFGETGETNLPFLSVCLAEDEKTFYAHSLKGAIHIWKFDDKTNHWKSSSSILGHHEAITDLCWEKSGAYLLSSSLDKTCRLHALLSIDNRWHELARPQVHGHELNCLVPLGFCKFASGADEKTIRAYEATQFFFKNFKSLANKSLDNLCSLENYPKHAQLPALGLSIRGAQYPYDFEEGESNVEPKKSGGDASTSWAGRSKLVEELVTLDHLESPPIEEILLQSTLWWETNKLFGHGNELYALAATSDALFMASASKANRSDLAAIIVWECDKFRKVATIEHHSLTITRLRFSPDDRFLLSVSRDRTWCLSIKTGQMRSAYKKLLGTSKSNSIHERIIWDCSWTFDSKYFMTVSRDKKAVFWSVEDLAKLQEDGQRFNTISSTTNVFDCSIQAVDSPNFDPFGDSKYLFALGFEDGRVELISISAIDDEWQNLKTLLNCHHLPIRRLAIKPYEQESKKITLASGGDDSILKLTEFNLE